MTGIYSKLFNYRPRPERLPLEDFSTEAFVHILEQMDPTTLRVFINDVLLHNGINSDAINRVSVRLEVSKKLSISTQHTTSFLARPDIVIFDDEDPFIVIENKIGAAFTEHKTENQDVESIAKKQQLVSYSDWLDQHATVDKPVALILLTVFTRPPEGFINSGEAGGIFKVKARNAIHWSKVHKWFETKTPTVTDKPFWLGLATDFIDFLEDKGMTQDDLQANDLATLGLMTHGSWNKSRDFFRCIKSALTEKFGNRSFSQAPRIAPEGGVIWEWKYLSGFDNTPWSTKDFDRWFFSWGLYFHSENQTFFNKELLANLQLCDHFFFYIGSDGTDIAFKRPHEGWLVTNDAEMVKFIPASDLLTNNGFTAEALKWLEPTFDEAITIISKRISDI